ncbi:hypothetical protein FQA47_000645 [Oryzias melastigma]|uniref:Uncharacterized protein n=1 Tax=Oryzias melastigma TaxID=30732 RepID=A0A834F5F7_ORYME|nr:hypothetical protein FQA47_000645 [Oryzias melastigma]
MRVDPHLKGSAAANQLSREETRLSGRTGLLTCAARLVWTSHDPVLLKLRVKVTTPHPPSPAARLGAPPLSGKSHRNSRGHLRRRRGKSLRVRYRTGSKSHMGS